VLSVEGRTDGGQTLSPIYTMEEEPHKNTESFQEADCSSFRGGM